jgi:hypothetical protein
VVVVDVFKTEDISKLKRRVGNDGTVSLPLQREVKVPGLSTQQIQEKLEGLQAESYLGDPVSVIGTVGKPGVYPLTARLARYGGIFLLHGFLQRLRLQRCLQTTIYFARRNNTYSIAEMPLALRYPILLGLGRLDTTDLLRCNRVFQALTGLPAYGNPSTLRRFLRRFARRTLAKFRRLHDRWLAQPWRRPKPWRRALFGLNSTVLTSYGRRQQPRIGYNPCKPGRPSYHPLAHIEGRTKVFWHGELLPGKVYSGQGASALPTAWFAKVPPQARQIRVPANVGSFVHEIIELIEGKRAFYEMVTRLTPPLKNRLPGLRYRRVAPGMWAGEFQDCWQWWPGSRHFMVIRRPVPGEPSPRLTLFQMGGCSYQALVIDLSLQALDLWRYYNRRAGGVDRLRIEVRQCPGEDSDERLPGRRGTLPDCLAGVQLAELVQTPPCPIASAAGHLAASSPTLFRGVGPVGVTGLSSDPASGTELTLGIGLCGYAQAHSRTPSPVLNLLIHQFCSTADRLIGTQKSSFITPDSGQDLTARGESARR